MLSLMINGIAAVIIATASGQSAVEPILVLNRGVGGATTRDGLAHFTRNVEKARPDHLVIYFGINDSANSGKLVPLSEFKKNLQSMVDRARAAGTRSIILVTMSPIITKYWALRHPAHPQKNNIDQYMARYDVAIREVAKTNKLPIADLRKLVEQHGGATTAKRSLIRNEANSNSKDGIHMREEGYRLMAELFAPIFQGKVKPGQVVVCLGDSLTYGAHVDGQGTSRGHTYPAYLQRLLNRMVSRSQTQHEWRADVE